MVIIVYQIHRLLLLKYIYPALITIQSDLDYPPLVKKNGAHKTRLAQSLNCVRLDNIAEEYARKTQSLLRLVATAYSKPSNLIFGNDVISSDTDVQQSDALGPFLLALYIDGIAKSAI